MRRVFEYSEDLSFIEEMQVERKCKDDDCDWSDYHFVPFGEWLEYSRPDRAYWISHSTHTAFERAGDGDD